MMFRRKPQPPARRQRLPAEPAPKPAAYSYHARRDERQEDAARKPGDDLPPRLKSGRFRLSRPTTLAVLLGAIVLAVALLGLSTKPKLEVIGSAGSTLVTPQQYAAAAQADLSQSVWNRNKLTVDTGQVKADLLKKFPELEDAAVTVPFFGFQPVIYVAPARPVLVLASANGHFLLDDRGKALVLQDNVSDKQYKGLPTVTDQSNLPVALNKQVLTPDEVSFISVVLKQLSAKQVAYGALVLPPSASEVDVYINGQPYYVKFNLQSNNAREEAGTYLATRQELSQEHVTPAQYIDVRIAGRAYYQ